MNKKVLSCAAHRMRRANWIRLNAKMAKYTVIAEYTVQAEVEIEAPSLDTAIAVVQVNPGDDVRRSVMLTHSWRVNRVETVDRNGWEGWWIDKVSIDNFNPGELQLRIVKLHTDGRTDEVAILPPQPPPHKRIEVRQNDLFRLQTTGEARSHLFIYIDRITGYISTDKRWTNDND